MFGFHVCRSASRSPREKASYCARIKSSFGCAMVPSPSGLIAGASHRSAQPTRGTSSPAGRSRDTPAMPQHRRVLLVRPVAGLQPGRRTAASSARMLALRSSKLRGSEPEVPLVRGGGKPAGYQPQTSSARSRHPANPSGSPANHRRHSRRYLRWHRDWATIPVSRPPRAKPATPASTTSDRGLRPPATDRCLP